MFELSFTMADYINELLEGRIDFEGQKLVEKLMYRTDHIHCHQIAAFITGFALQSLSLTFGTMGLSVAVLAVVRRHVFGDETRIILTRVVQAIIPPWPAYRSHPIKWLPASPQPAKK
ncbi:hypothetical protein BDN71DRAFT_1091689 [Pleurotus eryngii]|uniref:Signal peptidase complex subunit 1 n=1 Tax=Pleurotus eryngii TaxID=5323 RepID=A0A9P5ZVN3_PLEER|nr:hypothetical protein BDN71DRAFT_1091689 [Pleurotus eryngii]